MTLNDSSINSANIVTIKEEALKLQIPSADNKAGYGTEIRKLKHSVELLDMCIQSLTYGKERLNGAFLRDIIKKWKNLISNAPKSYDKNTIEFKDLCTSIMSVYNGVLNSSAYGQQKLNFTKLSQAVVDGNISECSDD